MEPVIEKSQSRNTSLEGRHIVLGVSGSIAVYKACALASLLVKAGAEVHPVLTRGGARFVTPATFAALCGRPVLIDEFDQEDPVEMAHITLAQRADAVVLAPASANLIARIAAGMTNDMLTLILTVTRAPVLLAPAMNTQMWTHPIISANIRKLEESGYLLVEPGSGRLACGTVGPGKLAEPEDILHSLQVVLSSPRSQVISDQSSVTSDQLQVISHQSSVTGDQLPVMSNQSQTAIQNTQSRISALQGIHILVTAGPTREPIDAVRFVSNRSSGKMGYALAEEAIARGAAVILVTGPTNLEPPAGAQVIPVQTAAEMREAVLHYLPEVKIVIAAAAVADFTVESPSNTKLKRGSETLTLQLKPTVDILAEIGRQKGSRFHVGFAAETGDPRASARAKLLKKNLDLIVANDVTAPDAGFDVDTNKVFLIGREGNTDELPLLSKREVASRILDHISAGLENAAANT